MSSINMRGDTFHGISVFGRGVFTNDERGVTYAGQCKDGHACGLGVLTWSGGTKEYAEHGPDGQFDGRHLGIIANGDTYYRLYQRGKQKEHACVFADGYCEYNDEGCSPDDPRLLALIAQIGPVEVHPAARAPTRHSPPTRRGAIGRWISRLGLLFSPLALAAAVATEVHTHAARRRWWPCGATQQQQSTTTQRRVCGPAHPRRATQPNSSRAA
jgi:hypothetical protein